MKWMSPLHWRIHFCCCDSVESLNPSSHLCHHGYCKVCTIPDWVYIWSFVVVLLSCELSVFARRILTSLIYHTASGLHLMQIVVVVLRNSLVMVSSISLHFSLIFFVFIQWRVLESKKLLSALKILLKRSVRLDIKRACN